MESKTWIVARAPDTVPAPAAGNAEGGSELVDVHARGSQDSQCDGDRISSREQESHLPGFFAVVGGRRTESLLPERVRVGELVGACYAGERHIGVASANTALLQCVDNGAFAKASGLLRDERLGKSSIGKIADCGKLIERAFRVDGIDSALSQPLCELGAA